MDVSNIALVKFFLSSNVERGRLGSSSAACLLLDCLRDNFLRRTARTAARPFPANAAGIPARNFARRIIALDILVRGN